MTYEQWIALPADEVIKRACPHIKYVEGRWTFSGHDYEGGYSFEVWGESKEEIARRYIDDLFD